MAVELKRWDYPEGSLLLGDCLKWMKKGMDPGSVDLVFGSPPYEQLRAYYENGEDLGIARATEEWVEWMVEIFRASLLVSKGLVAYVVGHGTGCKSWSGAPALLCADLIRAGVNLRSPCWYKRNGIMGSGQNDWLRADVEWIICAGPRDFPWSNNVACGHPPKQPPGGRPSHRTKSGKRVSEMRGGKSKKVSRQLKPGEILTRKRDKHGEYVQVYTPPEMANPGNVIDCGAVGLGKMGSNISHENEAPFPEKLPRFFIKSFCPPGGVVFDPFGGSGTTMSVCVQEGRKFLSCDLRPSQIELMQRRLKQARNRGNLL